MQSAGAAKLPNEPVTRVGANCLIGPIVADLGHDPARIFAAAGLTPDVFEDYNGQVSVEALGRLIAEAVAITGRRDLGLLVARRAGCSFIGAALHWLASNRTLRDSLMRYPSIVPANTRTAAARVVFEEDRALLELSSNFPVEIVATVIEEGMVGIAIAGYRAIIGERWHPLAVEFAHAPTAPTTVYQQLLDTRITFNRLRSAIIFSAADLNRSLTPPSTPAPAQPVLAATGGGLDIRVQAAIRARLSDPGLDRAAIAAELGLSTRTFNRRLAEHGVSFAALLQDTRYRTARQLLSASDTRLGAVALAVGYPDQSAFSRAFRQWSGQTPREWRAEHRR